jgi:hypothetical protein
MATFDFTSPEGKTYSVDGPDGATKEQAFQMLQTHLGTASPQDSAPQVGVGEDTVKGLAAGLGNQTLGVLGTPGVIREGLGAATSYLGNKFGFDADRIRNSDLATKLAGYTPDPSELRQGVTDPIVSPDYQPQSLLGKGAKLFGEYSLGLADPAALASPAGLGRAALTNVVAPAAGSEVAGKLTEGTSLETPARIASAFLSAYGASKGLGALGDARALKNATIAPESLRSQTSTGYDALRDANVGKPLPEGALGDVANTVRTDLNLKNQRPINAPELHATVDQMETPATAGAPDVADLLAARAKLKENIGTNPAGTKTALDSIDKAIENYSPDTISQLKELDKNWTGVRSGEALDKNLAIAERRAAGANSGLNLGNTIRQRVNSFLTSSQAKFLSDDMKAQLEKVNAGTATQNTLRDISNMLGKGHGLGGAVAGEIIGHIFGNDLAGLAVGTLAGRGTNALYSRSVASSARKAADAIRRETPAGQTFATANLPAKMTPAEFNRAIKAARVEHRRQAAIPAAVAGIYGVRSYADKNQ